MTKQERREKKRNALKNKFRKHSYKSLMIAQEMIIKRGKSVGRGFPNKTLTLKDSKK